MVYEDKKVIAISKKISEYKKTYIICVKSNQFWIIYDETNSYWRAKDIVNTLEYDDNECIIIRNKKGVLK